MNKNRFFKSITALTALIVLSACAQDQVPVGQSSSQNQKTGSEIEDVEYYDGLDTDALVGVLGCAKATASQLSVVNQGNAKKDQFLQQCARATGGSAWCAQLIRPNPSSIATFRCTYGSNQVHQLIHPQESTSSSERASTMTSREDQRNKVAMATPIIKSGIPELKIDTSAPAASTPQFATMSFLEHIASIIVNR